MRPLPLDSLIATWREQATRYSEDGVTIAARVLERVSRELEATWIEEHWKSLTIDQAAEETGYSASRLYELVATGKIENAGKKGAPRIRRCDLPRRPRMWEGSRALELIDDGLLEARTTQGRAPR